MPKMKNMDVREFYGYLISRDGSITCKDGTPARLRNGRVLKYDDGEKTRYRNIAIIIYELFAGETVGRDCVVDFRDGNDLNFAYDNIFLRPKKGRSGYSIFTAEQMQNILDEYHKDDANLEEKRKNNYRSNQTEFSSYRKLAKKHDCSLSTITKILNGTYCTACGQ